MTTILTPENLHLETQGAAHGHSFFYGEYTAEQAVDPTSAFGFARDFSIRFSDVLPEDVGVVLQAGIEPNGALVDINDAAKVNNLTLIFDARQPKIKYTWQLAVADTNGREVYQLHVTPGGCRTAHLSFDARGRLQVADEGYDDAGLAEIIQSMALHNRLHEGAEDIRKARANMGLELSVFKDEGKVEGILGLHPEFYDKELARKQKMIDHLGFTALKPLTA